MKHTAFFVILTAAGILTACQKDSGTAETALPQGAMSFNVLSPGVQTKVSGSAFESGDRAGLFVTDYADNSTPMPLQISGNRANNLAIVCNGVSWTPAKTVYWGGGKSDVYAYYPYIESITDIEEQPWSIAADQTKEAEGDAPGAYEASDFLWAKAEGVSQSGGAVNLEMKHIMSKLTVRIVAGEDYVGSLPEDASVLLHSTVTDAKVNLEKGSATKDSHSGAKSIKMKNLGIRTYDGVQAVVYEAIVVPQMLETSVPLIEINSKSVSYLLEDSFNFRPGTAYTYTATLNTSTTSIKVDIGCELDDWNSTGGSGSGGESGGESGDEDDDDGVEYTDLSAAGTANCYLVTGAGDYKFKTVLGNTDATVGNVKSVEVLWESFGTDEQPKVGDLIAKVSYRNGYIRFSTPSEFRQGNAVIAAKNSKGVILWSWHIWLSSEGWKEQVYYNNAGTMMDRNLGALSAVPGEVGALGLMYQGGRKDPFLGASSVDSNTQALSTGTWSWAADGRDSASETEENPMTFYFTINNGPWTSKKNVYDPCPTGWRVPDSGEKGVWAKASGKTDSPFRINISGNSYGLNLTGIFGPDETIWYPASGYICSTYHDYMGKLLDVGIYGHYWHTGSDFCEKFCILYNGHVYLWWNGYPETDTYSVGRAVRCCKE